MPRSAEIKIVAANVFGATAGMVEVQVEEERLLSPAQIKASLCPFKTHNAACGVLTLQLLTVLEYYRSDTSPKLSHPWS